MHTYLISTLTNEHYCEMMNGGYHFTINYWKIDADSREDAVKQMCDLTDEIVYTVIDYNSVSSSELKRHYIREVSK